MSTLNKNTIDAALQEISTLYPLSKEASKILKVYDKLPEDEKEYSTVDFLIRHVVSEINKKHNNGKPFVADWADGSRKYEIWWVWFRKPNKSDKKADILFNRAWRWLRGRCFGHGLGGFDRECRLSPVIRIRSSS